jgi:hypothetical protein
MDNGGIHTLADKRSDSDSDDNHAKKETPEDVFNQNTGVRLGGSTSKAKSRWKMFETTPTNFKGRNKILRSKKFKNMLILAKKNNLGMIVYDTEHGRYTGRSNT